MLLIHKAVNNRSYHVLHTDVSKAKPKNKPVLCEIQCVHDLFFFHSFYRQGRDIAVKILEKGKFSGKKLFPVFRPGIVAAEERLKIE